jgi:hypothetical protein
MPLDLLRESSDPMTDAIFFRELVSYHRKKLRECVGKVYGVQNLNTAHEIITDNLSELKCANNECDKSPRCELRQMATILADDLKAFDMEMCLQTVRTHRKPGNKYEGNLDEQGRSARRTLENLLSERMKSLSDHYTEVHQETLAYWKKLTGKPCTDSAKYLKVAVSEEKGSAASTCSGMVEVAKEKRYIWFEDWEKDASGTYQRLKDSGDAEAVRVAMLMVQKDIVKVETAYIDHLREIQSRANDCKESKEALVKILGGL